LVFRVSPSPAGLARLPYTTLCRSDRARSTPEATEAILKGLEWLGLDWDEEPYSQYARKDRHADVARQMLANAAAYKCFSTTEEIDRKSTRLNSSHVKSSYAVFCLK